MTRTLFHATTKEFSEFDLSKAGSISDHHDNSSLGIWFAVEHTWIKSFGSRIIKATIDTTNVFVMSSSDLFELSMRHNDQSFWIEYRSKLLHDGYTTVAIAEIDGRIEMYVVMDLACILDHKTILLAIPSGQ